MARPSHPHRIRMFASGANPLIDSFLRKSRAYVDREVAEGRADWRGGDVILRGPNHGEADHSQKMAAGTMSGAWGIKPSDGFMVWQMISSSSNPLPATA